MCCSRKETQTHLELRSALIILLATTAYVRAFTLPDTISLLRSYRKMDALKVYASDMFEDPAYARLAEMKDFSTFSCDRRARLNSSTSLFEKLMKDNYHDTEYSVFQE